ncbi:polymorphic toxin-type HINT domain-containing protein [Aquincola sp. MAHUQ-54]|uniref:Polymorphic toxin-type HINT domain-containing protein n=1 Tax=Aquincola agrisoli TaxID=3119538 RepID=A0AAW9QH08_9BURK
MSLNNTAGRAVRSLWLWWLIVVMALVPLMQAKADPLAVGGAAGVGTSATAGMCRPQTCFANEAAKRDYAARNNCWFAEDVCEGPRDDAPPPDADRGFWGRMWDGVKSGMTQGYQFVKGLVAGMKDQVEGLISLVTDFGDILDGLIALGKAFVNDPEGTLQKLAELIGQEVVDTIRRATQCGAYDTGKVIGENVSPVLVLKLAGKLGKYAGDLGRAVRETKHELGCASFAAGTPVHTDAGTLAIEQIVAGQWVRSRHDGEFSDALQKVSRTFGRTAPYYHELRTEAEQLKVTDEHPLWLQGRGWTPVKDIRRGDVVAAIGGDVTVLANERVDRPLQVFNFSVEHTPSYFVGEGVWVHNSKCALHERWDELDNKHKGFAAELEVAALLEAKGYTPVGKTFNIRDYPDVETAFRSWDGQTGIDGIYKNARGEYIIIESKGKGTFVKDEVEGCRDRLCGTQLDGRQLSMVWTQRRLEKLIPDVGERRRIQFGLQNNSVKRIYAQTDGNRTIFHEVLTPLKNGEPNLMDAVIGGLWQP